MPQPVKIVVAGHVDDGKSTLIGHLLYETNSLPDGKYEEIKALSIKRGMHLEWSFVLDAFQSERNQAITIDMTHIRLKTPMRDVLMIDAPGHIEFLKNMVSGAANADGALLLVDAIEGVREQTRRHAYLLHFLGIRQIAVLINKMDLVDYSIDRFNQLSTDVSTYLEEIGLEVYAIAPVSARQGDMLTKRTASLSWYKGPTVLEIINQFILINTYHHGPLRFPVQDVYKFDERRIIAGRIESGVLSVGDTLLFSPSGQTANIKTIESWNTDYELISAHSGQSIGITLDKQLFVERGDVISLVQHPPMLTTVFSATLFWLGQLPLEQGKSYKMKLLTQEIYVVIERIKYEINIENLTKSNTERLEQNSFGDVIIRSRALIPLDEYSASPSTGRFVLVDNCEIVAGGMISMKGYPDQRQAFSNISNLTKVPHHVSRENRALRSGHKGGILWFTGLSGAGKSTIAMRLEHRLFLKGYQIYTLDGDNIRKGLNSNLTFSPEDRMENIRRIGEVAALFTDAGFICVTAFISPYQADRDNVRAIVPEGAFHEVYIKADLETCEHRDPKGLYKKARSGALSEFTGVSAPYDTPANPELIVDTTDFDIERCVNQIIQYIDAHFPIDFQGQHQTSTTKNTEKV